VGVVLVTPPAVEPVSLAELKLHLRVEQDQAAEDDLITSLGKAAREYAEKHTRRSFITTTWRKKFGRFCNRMVLDNPPLIAVSTITYVDDAGDSQTLSASLYQVVSSEEPGFVCPAYAVTWPTTRNIPEAVTVNYTAGYGATAASVPEGIKAAIKLIVGNLYENREAVADMELYEVPMAARMLLDSFDCGVYV
jgi:uncharacterized phiE125 gp8 family phage protein